MKSFWSNLRPMEKRLFFGVGVLILVLANFWVIVPHFSDWSRVKERREKAIHTLEMYNQKLDQRQTIDATIRKLEGEGLAVPAAEQQGHFASAIQSQAAQSQITIIQTGRQQTKTNQFFLELSQNISVQAKESQLVDFLYNLGAGNSLIRVRDLRLHPDPARQQLQGDIRLVASYQKNVPTRVVAPAGKTSTPTSTATNKPPVAKPPTPTTTTTAAPPKTNQPPKFPGPGGPTNRPHFNIKKT
jgi:type II secretory pathway component PulM